MTFLRIIALVFAARLTIEFLNAMFGESVTTVFLWIALIVISGQLLIQLWRKQKDRSR